jgi:uncharacterized membrane protein
MSDCLRADRYAEVASNMLRDRNPKHWKLLIFYYNPDESRLFVAKRYGSPITLNFAKPMAWAIVGLTLAIPIIGAIIDIVHSGR